MELVILPEIEDLLYPLKPEELSHLENSIKEEGVRDPLVVWDREEEHILVDGHHRYAIATKHKVEYKTVNRSFGSMEEALDWVDKNQLGRRNLTDEERTLTVGRVYQRMRDHRAAVRVSGDTSGEQQKGKTANQVAEDWNMSPATVKRSSDFASAIGKLKEYGENGEIAAQRILKGDIKDGISELPVVFKNSPERFQELADGLANGAKKIREVIKQKTKVHNITPSVGEQGRPVTDNTTDKSVMENATYQGDNNGSNMESDDADFMESLSKASEAAETQEFLHPKISKMEAQANILQCFGCFDILQKMDPSELWEELPKYVKEQISSAITDAAQWFGKLSQHVNGEG